jgi:hypothetical protein
VALGGWLNGNRSHHAFQIHQTATTALKARQHVTTSAFLLLSTYPPAHPWCCYFALFIVQERGNLTHASCLPAT